MQRPEKRYPVFGGKKALALSVLALFALLAAQAEIRLGIHFFDKRIYFPGSEILIKITVSNEGEETYRFKLADDRLHSISFEARSASNRMLEAAGTLRVAMSESRPVYYREVSIKAGEEYSFIERLERYVSINDAGTFTIRASFFPELAGGGAAAIVSNALILSVRPSPGLPPASDALSAFSGEVLKPIALSPDEVVRRTVLARQRGLWNEFFLYMDLESLLRRNEDARRLYDRGSDESRMRAIERYKADLQTNLADQDLAAQPYYFEIIETRYTPSKGFVRVQEKFQTQQLKLVKEYNYELERRDEIWYIIGYSVVNKGTE